MYMYSLRRQMNVVVLRVAGVPSDDNGVYEMRLIIRALIAAPTILL